MIRFFVAGDPKTMSVGKTVRVPNGRGFNQFQERRNTDWATLVRAIGREHRPPAPLRGAITFTAHFWMPRPDSAPKRVLYPLKRPDVDNLVHKMTDSFNGVFYVDDSQIIDLVVRKRFAGPDGRTGLEVIVEELEEEQPRPAAASSSEPGLFTTTTATKGETA